MTSLPSLRSPATLAARLHKVMDRAAAHLPLLSDLGARVHEHASWQAGGLEAGLQALHDSLAALEGGSAQGTAERAQLEGGALHMRACSQRVSGEVDTFIRRSELGAGALAPALGDFLPQFRALEKVVDRCSDWFQEMQQGLARQQALAAGRGSVAALESLAERADGLRSRLALLQAVDRSARNVHALADCVAVTRPKLLEVVQDKLKPACALLGTRLDEQPVREARAPATATAVLRAARTDAQTWATQALSLAIRLQVSQDRLVREAGALRHRCSLLPRPCQDADRPQAVRRDAWLAPPTGIESVAN